MATTDANEWPVLPHGPIHKLSDVLWCVEGDLKKMGLNRWMTIVRLSDGRLVIHNAVALAAAAMAEIEAFGAPAFILVPNAFHRIDCARFKQRYPAAKVLCPRGARAKVERVVTVDGTYDDLPPDPHAHLRHLDGVADREGVLSVHDAHGTTLVFNDVLFNIPRGRGFKGFMLGLIGSSGGPKVTRIARLAIVKDKRALSAELLRLSAEPALIRLVPGHGERIESEARSTLDAVAQSI
jgi:hypothetical protein